ncbi:MAG: hypothetical protein AB7T31_08010 [Gemmatimonadales bacterium]
MRRFALSFAVVAVLFARGTDQASAQDEWVQQVRTYLEAAAEIFEDRGYRSTHELFTGSLDDDASEPVRFDLKAGIEYYILGACDNDCSDLDLVLFDPSGTEVDSDLLEDDAPVVSVTPSSTAGYRVEVRMVTCSAEPCRYGIGIWGQ